MILPKQFATTQRRASQKSTAHQVAICLCVMFVVGCATNETKKDSILKDYKPPGQTNLRVESLEIKGLETLEEEDLREGLATKEDPGWRTAKWISWLPLIGAEKSYFNEVSWRNDQARVRAWLKSNGYFNASVSMSKNRKKNSEWISLTIKIKENKPIKVTTINFVGLGAQEIKTVDLTLRRGDTFNEKSYERSKASIRNVLRQQSYAYAQVDGRVIIDPKRKQARITYFVDTGPRAYIRNVTIKGLEDVTKSYVEEAVTLEKGQLYSDNTLLKTQENIYALGVFSLVTVQPAFELKKKKTSKRTNKPPTKQGVLKKGEMGPLGISIVTRTAQMEANRRRELNPNVDVVIQVKEAKKFSVRLGAGFSIEGTRQDIHLQANWTSRNFLNSLLRLEHFNTVGYAVTPGFVGILFNVPDEGETFDQLTERLQREIGNNGVFFDSKLSMTKPQFFERNLEAFAIARVRREIQQGYIGLSPSASIGLRRRFFDNLKLEASYSLLFYQYQSLDDDFRRRLIEQELIRANDSDPSQFLETFEQRITYDRRNNLINPTSGYKIELALQQAGDYILGGQFKYFKPTLSVEGYLPYSLGTKMVTAIRGRMGSIYNLNDAENDGVSIGIPVQSRYFAGGRNSMRSFGARFLSPFTSSTLMGDDESFDPVPVGGTSLLEASVEQRFRIYKNFLSLGELWTGLYVDTATVLEQPLYFDTSGNQDVVADMGSISQTLLYGVGGGLWWLTPVGPIRFDFAYTLSDIAAHPNFQTQQVREKILGYNFYLGIGHSF